MNRLWLYTFKVDNASPLLPLLFTFQKGSQNPQITLASFRAQKSVFFFFASLCERPISIYICMYIYDITYTILM